MVMVIIMTIIITEQLFLAIIKFSILLIILIRL